MEKRDNIIQKEYKLKYTGEQIENSLDNIGSQSLSIESLKLKIGEGSLKTTSSNLVDSINEISDRVTKNNFKGIAKEKEVYRIEDVVFYKSYLYESKIDVNELTVITDIHNTDKWEKITTLNKDYNRVIDNIIPDVSITRHNRLNEYPKEGIIVYNIEDGAIVLYITKQETPKYIELNDLAYWKKFEIGVKMNPNDYYKKREIDEALNYKVNTEIFNESLSNKVNTDDLNNYFNKDEINTKLESYATKDDITTVFKFAGSVDNVSDLPENTAENPIIVGTCYNVRKDGYNYVWTGTEWDSLAGEISFSDYYTKTEIDTNLNDNYYDKTEIDEKFELDYRKTEIDEKFNSKVGTEPLVKDHTNVIDSLNSLWGKYDEFIKPYVFHEIDEIPIGTIIYSGQDLSSNPAWLPFGENEVYNDDDYPELAAMVKSWNSSYIVDDTKFTLGNHVDVELYLTKASATYPQGTFVRSRLPNASGYLPAISNWGCSAHIFRNPSNVDESVIYTPINNESCRSPISHNTGVSYAEGSVIAIDLNRCSSIYLNNTPRVLADSIALKMWIKAKKTLNKVRLSDANNYYDKQEVYNKKEIDNNIIDPIENKIVDINTKMGNKDELVTKDKETIVSSINSIANNIQYDVSDSPVGTLISILGNKLPSDNYLWCDGQTYKKKDYPELAKVLIELNPIYNVDEDNFKVPDMKTNNKTIYQADDSKPLGSVIEASLPNLKGRCVERQFWNISTGVFSNSHNGTTFFQLSSNTNPAYPAWYVDMDASIYNRIYKDGSRVYSDAIAVNFCIKARPTYLDKSLSSTEQPIGTIISNLNPNPPSSEWLPFNYIAKIIDYPILANICPQEWVDNNTGLITIPEYTDSGDDNSNIRKYYYIKAKQSTYNKQQFISGASLGYTYSLNQIIVYEGGLYKSLEDDNILNSIEDLNDSSKWCLIVYDGSKIPTLTDINLDITHKVERDKLEFLDPIWTIQIGMGGNYCAIRDLVLLDKDNNRWYAIYCNTDINTHAQNKVENEIRVILSKTKSDTFPVPDIPTDFIINDEEHVEITIKNNGCYSDGYYTKYMFNNYSDNRYYCSNQLYNEWNYISITGKKLILKELQFINGNNNTGDYGNRVSVRYYVNDNLIYTFNDYNYGNNRRTYCHLPIIKIGIPNNSLDNSEEDKNKYLVYTKAEIDSLLEEKLNKIYERLNKNIVNKKDENIITFTQAEYDALSEKEKNNGKIYIIQG